MAEMLDYKSPLVGDTAELAVGASLSLAGRISGRVIHLVTQIAVGRLFGPQSYGMYAIGLTMLRMAGLVSSLGMDTAVVRYGARFYPANATRLSWVLALGVGVPVATGFVIGGGLFSLADMLASEIFGDPALAPVIRWFAIGIGPLAGLQAAAAATRISKRMQYSVLSQELTQPALALLLILVFSLLGLGILGAAAATVLSFGAGLVLALYYLRRLFPGVIAQAAGMRGPWRELLIYSASISGSRIFILLMTWVDRLALGSFRSAAEVGVYQAAAQSAVLFAIILGAFNSILSPIVADLWHRGERERLEATYRVSTKWGLYLGLPFFVVIALAPAQVLSVVYGPDYAGGAAALTVLAAGQLVNAGTGAVGLLLSITGYQKRWVATAAAMLALDISLIVILVPRLGILGAALATAGTVVGLFVVGLAQVRGSLAIWPYDRRYLKGLIAALSSAALVYWLTSMSIGYSFLGLLGLTIGSGVAFGAVLLALGLDEEDKQFVGLVRSRLARNQLKQDG